MPRSIYASSLSSHHQKLNINSTTVTTSRTKNKFDVQQLIFARQTEQKIIGKAMVLIMTEYSKTKKKRKVK